MKTSNIYLISSDGYRDSINLDYCVDSLKKINKILMKDLDIYGAKLLPKTVLITSDRKKVVFKYIDLNNEEDEGVYYIHKIKVL